ncbi:hypothetical protein ILUMI_16592 [Ignelater luminosus]|uniref:Reverse transcriptase Ty1/copia-type domain-containing protein n=1 Tax=Ignelater luminosus TaxID=2038154 RepID=A0A8K0CSM8_IGNLU|nr:hypothetical protein ILUMI_16592 [Ignelater luminosus]
MSYLVGYCGDEDGYRVRIPDKNDVVLTRDVIFKNEKTSRIIWKYPSAVTQDTKDKDMKNSEDIQEVKNINEEHEEVRTKNFENITKLRSRSNIKKPSKFDDFVMLAIHDEPTNFEELNWREAMEDKLNSLSENQTWKLVDLPTGKRAIENRWVYRVKNNPDGTVDRFKVRLVVKEYAQKPGEDFQETFSPVPRFDTLRTLLSVAAAEKQLLYQFDISTAFLYGELYESTRRIC